MIAVLTMALAAAPSSPTWLAGCWENDTYQEVWTRAEGSLLVGASVFRKEKPTWEHLRIAPGADGVLSYIASPSDQATTAFPATSVTATEAVFENPSHDFPQRIRYALVDRALRVTVETLDGSKGFELQLARCK